MWSVESHPRVWGHELTPEQVSAIWRCVAAAALVATLIVSALFESGQLASAASSSAGAQRSAQGVPILNSTLAVEVNEHAFCICLQGGQ